MYGISTTDSGSATLEARSRLRRTVDALAAIERRATTDGERRSAHWVAGELRKLGADDVRLSTYDAHSTWAVTMTAHSALALAGSFAGSLAGSVAGRVIARMIAIAAAISLEADAVGRNGWVRKLLPGRRVGTNVDARLPALGEPRRTVVLVAHHDAAHNGLVWHPASLSLGRRVAARTGVTPAYNGPTVLGMLAVAAGPARARRLGQVLLGVSIAASVQAAFSKTVPGANDNASGVAGLLELGRRLASDPIDGLETILLSPGGEEAGGVGISGWLDRRQGDLDPASTLFVGLDSIGSGEPVISIRESSAGRYRKQDLELVDRAADRAGLSRPRCVGLGAISDPLVARYRGFRSISLLAWRNGTIANLHRPTDVPENVDLSSAEQVVELAHAVIEEWATGDPR